MTELYGGLPSISIDFAVMEQLDDLVTYREGGPRVHWTAPPESSCLPEVQAAILEL